MTILSKIASLLTGKRPEDPASPEMPPIDFDDTQDTIQMLVASGYDDIDAIVEAAFDIHSDEGGELDREGIRQLVLDEMRAHEEDEATWDAPTDCDRLDEAFASLRTDGIVARQNFSCCQTCGNGEIQTEMVEDAAAGAAVRGYAYFHQQDTESAVSGHGLYLAYGPYGKAGKNDTVEVARIVVDRLREAGLNPEWDGTSKQRIFVPMDWRRRRSAA